MGLPSVHGFDVIDYDWPVGSGSAMQTRKTSCMVVKRAMLSHALDLVHNFLEHGQCKQHESGRICHCNSLYNTLDYTCLSHSEAYKPRDSRQHL